MAGLVMVLGFLAVTSWTDLREGKIYNWTTYPGLVIALLASLIVTVTGIEQRFDPVEYEVWWGIAPLADCLKGFGFCSAIMVCCYVFFAGQVGGGDIKLIAMIGAFLGLYDGLEAMLWAFVIAAMFALCRLVWRIGAWKLLSRSFHFVFSLIRYRTRPRLSDEERQPLKASLCLSPSAMLAVLVVKWDWMSYWLTEGMS